MQGPRTCCCASSSRRRRSCCSSAQAAADEIDLDFLWECAPQDEFGFEDLAREYYGQAPDRGARRPPSCCACTARRCTSIARGAAASARRRPEILKQALAAVERKRQQEQLRQQYVEHAQGGRTAAGDRRARRDAAALRPDKNGVEYKAVEQAASELQMSPLRLLLARGAIALAVPLAPATASSPPPFRAARASRPTCRAPALPADLPLAPVAAFSIDDSATTEIDDAFSVQWLGEPHARRHPHRGAGDRRSLRGDALDAVARARMSTVYAPGLKIHDAAAEPGSRRSRWREGAWCRCCRCTCDVDADTLQAARRSRRASSACRSPPTCGTTCSTTWSPRRTMAARRGRRAVRRRARCSCGASRAPCWRGAKQVRGRPEPLGRIDYGFALDFAGDEPTSRRTSRSSRAARGAPLDLIVAELMILANSHWGGWLAELSASSASTARSSALHGASRVQHEHDAGAARGHRRAATTRGARRRCGATWTWSTSAS
ncbi:MAG: hypothetical protein MZW92_34245 [Comamonadaceae bacterium]|nr:hypothetical protein [Comamonadaceae bacterium]